MKPKKRSKKNITTVELGDRLSEALAKITLGQPRDNYAKAEQDYHARNAEK